VQNFLHKPQIKGKCAVSQVDQECRYADSHEWVRVEGDIATVGISDHAQALLGDLVYVELPEVGASIDASDEAGVVESVKAASDVYCPISGTIMEINGALEDSPELINSSPYADGWLFKVKLNDLEEVAGLMTAEDYEDAIEE